MNPYFELDNLRVGFKVLDGTADVLDIDNLAINKGEIYGLVGESGAGKTVLAQNILRLLPSPPCIVGENSRIMFDGRNLLSLSEKAMETEIRGRKIAMIFQDPMSTLNPVFTIGQQIADVIMRNRGIKKPAAIKEAGLMLEKVRMPDVARVMEKYPLELSGGQRQRVIIATALSCGAEFLIADEPTRNLDVTIQAGILKIIDELKSELNITVLFIGNNMSLMSVMCDNIAVLRQGRIIERGASSTVINSPEDEYTRMLMESLPDNKPEKKQGSEALINVKGLKKHFPLRKGLFGGKTYKVLAVDGVDLTIYKGDTIGIVGESGCGKTTLVNVLLNLEKPTDGDVMFKGKDIFNLSKTEMRSLRKNIQIVFQDPFWSLDPRMLIRDVIGEPLKVHAKLGAAEYLKKVEELLTLVGLSPESAFMFPHEFSGGQRQRIAIARALALEADFIVLDEPTSSIDVVSQTQILELLENLKQRYGLTYVVVSHDLSVVHFMSNRIVVMYLGKIVEEGDSDIIFENPVHFYTKALFEAIPTLSMNSVNQLRVMEQGVPSAIDVPTGCRFHTRCVNCKELCKTEEPQLIELEDGRRVACHYID